MLPIHLKTILELLQKLRAIRGQEIDYAWLNYLLDLYHGKQEILGLLLIMSHHYLENPLIESKIFLNPPAKNSVDGEYRLGNVVFSNQKLWPFGLQESDWIRHVLIAGKSGFGKTNLARLITMNFLQMKKPFLVFDWKRNFRCLLKVHPSVYCFTVGRQLAPFRVNVTRPPPGVEPKEWLGHLVDTLCEAYFLGHGAHRILTEVIHQAYKELGVYQGSGNYPNWNYIYQLLDVYRLKAKSRELMWVDSSLRVAFALSFGPMGEVLNGEDLQIHDLLESNVIMELEALNSSDKKFLTEIILQYILSYRKATSQPREVFRHAIMTDEGHHIFLEKESEFQAESVPDRIFREIREYGESLIICDQHISKISKAAVGNSSVIFNFHTSLKDDVKVAAGATRIEEEYFAELPPGQAIVKMSERYYKPFLIQAPLLAIGKLEVSDEEIASRVGIFLERLANIRRIASAIADSTEVNDFSGLSKKTIYPALERKGVPFSPEPAKEERKIAPFLGQSPEHTPSNEQGEPVAAEELSEDEQMYLIDVLKFPHSGVVERNKRLSLTARQGDNLKSLLLAKGFIETLNVSTGTTRQIITKLTGKAQELMKAWGHVPEQRKREGGAQHEYWKERLASFYEGKGYKTVKEFSLNGKTVDLVAQKNGDFIAVEVETGKSDYMENLRKCIKCGKFSSIVMFCINRTLKAKVLEHAQKEFNLEKEKVIIMTPKEIIKTAPRKLNLVKTYLRYFDGRENAFTEQIEDGSYKRIDGRLSGRDIAHVLQGRKTYGIYQVMQDNMVNFICFDLDNHHGKLTSEELGRNVMKLLGFLLCHGFEDKQLLVEKSSRSGYHVWMFFKIPLKCSKAHQFAQFVREISGIECEGFPKQAFVDKDGYGNCVRLPLSVHRKKKERSLFTTLDLQEIPFNKSIEHLATIKRVDTRAVNRYVFNHGTMPRSNGNGNKPVEGEPGRMRERCSFVRFVEDKPNEVSEPQWFLFLELCLAYGDEGVKYAFEVSRRYRGFREREFWNKVKYIQRRGYRAPACNRIRQEFACDCAEGMKTPVKGVEAGSSVFGEIPQRESPNNGKPRPPE